MQCVSDLNSIVTLMMTNDLRFLKQQPSPPTKLSEKTLTFGFQNFYLKQFLQIFSEFDNSIFRLVFLGLIA